MRHVQSIECDVATINDSFELNISKIVVDCLKRTDNDDNCISEELILIQNCTITACDPCVMRTMYIKLELSTFQFGMNTN